MGGGGRKGDEMTGSGRVGVRGIGQEGAGRTEGA